MSDDTKRTKAAGAGAGAARGELDPLDPMRRAADRFERDGRPAMAMLFRQAIFIEEGGDMRDFAWAVENARGDGRTDDVSIRGIVK